MASRPKKPRDLFYETLTAAINDLLEHGFDSQQRLEMWVAKLETAARATLVPEATLNRSLKDMLLKVYQRTVEGDALINRHSGISQFTLASIKIPGQPHFFIPTPTTQIQVNASVNKIMRAVPGSQRRLILAMCRVTSAGVSSSALALSANALRAAGRSRQRLSHDSR